MLSVLCPYCHARIELAEDATELAVSTSITCAQCGEAFFSDAHDVICEPVPAAESWPSHSGSGKAQTVFYVNCIHCQAKVEIPPDAVGPNRTDPWNVTSCCKCGMSFDYDDDDVITDDCPPSQFI
jgi:hypothetical protein